MKEGDIFTTATLLKKLVFKGDNFLKNIEEKRRLKQYICIGSLQVDIMPQASCANG
jgi:hypothetical protein